MAIKHFKTKLYKEKLIKSQRDTEVYSYYFMAVAEKLRVPLQYFMNPYKHNLPSHQKSRDYKSFGKKFIVQVLQSESFRQDFYRFLQTEIFEFYKNHQTKKISNIINKFNAKFETLLDTNKPKEQNYKIIFEQINDFFISQKLCKLPWSFYEIKQSISSICLIIKELNLLG